MLELQPFHAEYPFYLVSCLSVLTDVTNAGQCVSFAQLIWTLFVIVSTV